MNSQVVHVVEDDDDQFLIFEYQVGRVLESRRSGLRGAFEVVRSRSLAEAIERETSRPSALVLLDLGLPDSGVTETAQRFTTAAPEARVFVLTSLDDDDLAASARRAGAVGFACKADFTGEAVLEILGGALAVDSTESGPSQVDTLRPPANAPRDRTAERLAGATRRLAHDALGEIQIILYRARALESAAAHTDEQAGAHGDVVRRACEALRGLVDRARRVALDQVRPLELEAIGSAPLDVQVPDGGPTLVVETPPAALVADRRLLTDALTELVRNALEHSSGASRVAVRFERDAADWLARVEDDGAGAEDAVERMNAALGREMGRETGREAGGGAGLGLLRAERIAQRHGGRLDCEARAGGATVTLRLRGQ